MAKLYKKDYIAIAQALHCGMSVEHPNGDDNQWFSDRVILACAERIADVYQREQANFDRSKFIEWVKRG